MITLNHIKEESGIAIRLCAMLSQNMLTFAGNGTKSIGETRYLRISDPKLLEDKGF